MTTDSRELQLLHRALDCGGALALFFEDYSADERLLLEDMTHPARSLFNQTTPGVYRITDRGQRTWQTSHTDA